MNVLIPADEVQIAKTTGKNPHDIDMEAVVNGQYASSSCNGCWDCDHCGGVKTH